MKKVKIIFISSIILATISFALTISVAAANSSSEVGRYLIKSDNGILKAITGVRHNFDSGFTTELTTGQLKALEMLTSRLGISIEPVALYHISAPPGACSPWPECNKNGGDDDSTRQYYPDDQTPWGIEKIYGDTTITSTSGGLDIDVAVLDTGVYKNHPDLKARVEQCKDFTKGPRIKANCDDKNGHGTHVAGTILADAGTDSAGIYGIAPQSDLFAYKVCDNSGLCWADDIATAIKHAADQGAEIVSMSLGGDTQSSLIKDVVDYATSAGVLIVAAAGNDGPDLGSIDYPSANVKVIAAGAIDLDSQVPDWSSRGVNDGDYIIEKKEVEFGAPGVNIESTWLDGSYYYASGTSMATPHVSGLAAKLWQGNAADTRAYLQSIAQDIWDTGDDPATGFGLPAVQ